MGTHEYHTNIDRPQTAKKLAILRKYFAVWLSIWSGRNCAKWVAKKWFVFDLFAGTGVSHGADGTPISGSPIVFLEEIASKAERLKEIRCTITLYFIEQEPSSYNDLRMRVAGFIETHPQVKSIVEVKILCEDCNKVVAEFADSASLDGKMPAFIFVDPFGLAIQHPTMDSLMKLPWAADVLFNYMLDGIKRVYGAAISESSYAKSNAATLAAYFGESVVISGQEEIENPQTYTKATFGIYGLLVVAFYMKWPAKESTQYILLFASRKPKVVNIMRNIYAKEMEDQYGQSTLFGTEEHLTQIEVIKP